MDIIKRHSPNYAELPSRDITIIVIHDTGGRTAESALSWMESPLSNVSSHYLVDKDGTIYQLVEDEDVAWHVGASVLWHESDLNRIALGIELVDDSLDKYPDEQMTALIDLTAGLCDKYQIPLNRIVGHENVAMPKGRKVDPGADFPWFMFLNTVGSLILDKSLKEEV